MVRSVFCILHDVLLVERKILTKEKRIFEWPHTMSTCIQMGSRVMFCCLDVYTVGEINRKKYGTLMGWKLNILNSSSWYAEPFFGL